MALYFFVIVRFRLRARTAFLASLNLANYSEFGLIVGAIALANGWLSGDWLVIVALALTMTFIIAAPLNAYARGILAAAKARIERFETPTPLPEDAPIELGDARIAIIGMSRVGAGAYDTLKAKYGDVLVGIDADLDVVAQHKSVGRNVILADATDDEFWARVQAGNVTIALLAMPEYEQNLGVAQRIQQNYGDRGPDYSVADNPEQTQALRAAGVDAVWNFDTEAGKGFAEEVITQLGDSLDKQGAQ